MDNIVTVKERVSDNGQKVTKQYEYRDSKIHSTTTSFYDSKTGVLKKTTVYGEGNPPHISMKDKKGYRFRLNYANNNGQHYVSSIHLQDPKGNHLLDYYGNSTIEQAKTVIKEHNLPFEI